MTARVSVRGYLGKDMTVRHVTSKGEPVAVWSGSIGSSHKSYDRETKNQVSETDWYQIDFWSGSGFKNADEFLKGDHVLVEGQLTVDRYLDKAGNPQQSLKIKANLLLRLAPGSGRPSESVAEDLSTAVASTTPF